MKNIPSDKNRSDDTLFSLLESLPDAAFLMERNGAILKCNALFASRYGKNPQECIGLNLYDLIATVLNNPKLASRCKKKSARVFQTGKRTVFDDREGNTIRSFTLHPLRTPEGEISGLFITIQDSADQKRLGSENSWNKPRFSFALEAAHAGVWEWNLKTNTFSISSEIWALFGLEWRREKPSFQLLAGTIHPDDRELAIQTVATATQNGTELSVEYRVCHPDGSIHWLMSRGKPLREKSGEAISYIGTIIDITDSKQTASDLVENKIRFNYALDAAHSGIWEWNVITDELSWSDQVWGLYGLKVKSMPLNHQLCVATVHPDDREMTSRIIRDAVRNGVGASPEYRVCHPDGSIHWLVSRAIPLRDAEGRLTRYIGTIIDITDSKEKEILISESKTMLSQALKAASAGVWEWNLSTNENIWSEEIWPLYGLVKGNDKPSFDLWTSSVHPDDREMAIRTVTSAARNETELNVEYRICYPDGSIHWFMSRGMPLRNSSGHTTKYIGTVIDITSRKESEIALKESETRFTFALEAAHAGVFEWDIHSDKVIWSDQVWALYGMKLNSMEMTHKLCASSVHPDDRDVAFQNVIAAASTANEIHIEYRVCHPDRSIHWLICRGRPLINADGRVTHYIGTVIDNTEKKLLELSLKESEFKFKSIFDYAPFAIFIEDIQNGQLVEINYLFSQLLGYRREEVIGRPASDLGLYLKEDEREEVIGRLKKHDRLINRPLKLQKKSGEIISVLYSGVIITLNNRPKLLVMMTDVTLQQLQQENISQLERVVEDRTEQLQLEVKRLHRFLNMISHEYRTPLAIIRGNLDIIKLKNNGNNLYAVEMNKIYRAIDRLVEVMDVSIQESRVTESYAAATVTHFEIAPIIASQLEAFRAMWPERSIISDENLGKSKIIGEPPQIQLAIFNLLDNARKYSAPDSPIEIGCSLDGNEVVIKVRNEGPPITDDEGEAFFKKYQRGTNARKTAGAGLGLWLVRSIISEHKGLVTLKGIASGVEAIIRLPVAK